jgi:hypothetical protein
MTNRRIALASALLVATLAGCAEPMAAGGASRPGEPGHTDTRFPTGHDALAVALGTPVLSTTRLGRGEREMRLWPSSGPGRPSLFIRLADRRGTATADIYAYWRDTRLREDSASRADFEAFVRHDRHCGAIRYANAYGFCLVHAAPPERAKALLAYVDSIRGWNAADPDPDPPGHTWIQLDGRGLGLEVRDGGRYRAARFGNRHFTPGSVPEALYRLPSRF